MARKAGTTILARYAPVARRATGIARLSALLLLAACSHRSVPPSPVVAEWCSIDATPLPRGRLRLHLRLHNTAKLTTRTIDYGIYDTASASGLESFTLQTRLRPGQSRTYIVVLPKGLADLRPGNRIICSVEDVNFTDGSLWTPMPHLMPL